MTKVELSYRAELRANWSSFAWWKGRGWSRLPGWVKRRRETMKMRGHPCRGCSSIAYRGEIQCPLLGEKLSTLRLKATYGAIAEEYVAEQADLARYTMVDQPEGEYIPANLCRSIRRKTPAEAVAYLLARAKKLIRGK